MLISELYVSRQGEGLLTGQESVFLRTSGCNLRCSFCDTPFASWAPEGDQKSVEEILDSIPKPSTHVVVTGGEPMVAKEMPELCSGLKQLGLHITIETAGTIFRPLDCDLFSISPKLSNSDPAISPVGDSKSSEVSYPVERTVSKTWLERHQTTRDSTTIVQQLISQHDFQLKFVVGAAEDLVEIQAYLKQLGEVPPNKVYLMPEGIEQDVLESRKEWLQPLCDEFGYSFCPRMHIEWYGNKRGT